jgi:uncharacterized protein
MITRQILAPILDQVGKYSVIMITGPRQSGKTTLIREHFPELPYLSLENPDTRQQLQADPKALFRQYGHRLILDEVQRLPILLSYIQGIVDEDRDSLFILSGSQNYLMMEGVSQTLAGRVALFYLLPLSYPELSSAGYQEATLNDLIWQGGYPRIYDRGVDAATFYQSYLETYVQRDVRLIQNVGNLNVFTQFLAVCATFAGQTLNKNALASAAGVSHSTVNNWLSILEASYLIYRVNPYYRNFKKRLIKSPRLYFYDTGLACALLRIQSAEALQNYYQRGALFENWVVTELAKTYYNTGARPPFYHWRDSNQREIDLLLDHGATIQPIEIKSGSTYRDDFFKHLTWFTELSPIPVETPTVIYGGEQDWEAAYGQLLSWRRLRSIRSIH